MQADLANTVNFLRLFLSLLISHPHVYSLLFSFQIIHSKSKDVTSTQIKKSGIYVTHTTFQCM